MYLPRREGGRGLMNITSHYKNAIIEEYYLTLASNWQFTRGVKSIHAKASKYCQELQLDYNNLRVKTKPQRKSTIKTTRIKQRTEELEQKPTHGQFVCHLNEATVDKTTSNLWLKSSTLKRTTESSICAI